MKADTLPLHRIFDGERRFVAPLYQRPYVWERTPQLETFWEDIREIAERLLADETVSPQFLGAIVLDQVRQQLGFVETRTIIDGQQRLTTSQLFLEAFADLCEASGATDEAAQLRTLTRNRRPMSKDLDAQFKVWPTNADQAQFRTVMNARHRDEAGHGRIAAAYQYFHEQLEAWLGQGDASTIRAEALLRAVWDHLRVVVIDLDRDDDAQTIFETLNARGTPLLPSDLVKNYLLQRARREGADLDVLYQAHWQPMDEKDAYWRHAVGSGHAARPRIDVFLLHYLTLQVGGLVPARQLFASFAAWADRERDGDGKLLSAEAHLARLAHLAGLYRKFEEGEGSPRRRQFFERLQVIDVTSVYPLALELARRGADDPVALDGCLVDLESFLVRRMLCGLNTRGYNRFFATLLGKVKGQEGPLAGHIRAALLAETADSSRWPDDEELEVSWRTVTAYKALTQRRVAMVLQALEEALVPPKAEKLPLPADLTVEHLLPTSWQACWPLPPGDQGAAKDRRERLLHTFGNLTLVSGKLNPAMSNGAWEKKRQALHDNSRLFLNRDLEALPAWDEDAIEARSGRLFDLVRSIWPRVKG